MAKIKVFQLLHPFLNNDRSSSLCSTDNCLIQNVALKITCIKVLDLALLNTISFLFNHIAQQSAAAPSKIWFLSLGLNLCRHEPNKLVN